ncbi:MAG: methionyl-tRNA formyltransferase [Pseudomonadota bacterium]
MRIIFMGTPAFSVPVLQALVAAGHDITAVYTQPPRPAGRGKQPRPTPVATAARALSLEVRHPISLKSADALSDVAALNADLAVVVAYGLLLPQAILDTPTRGCLNIHASLLPRWRGAAPIHRAVMAGDSETGVCVMQMEAELDAGPVLTQARTTIGADDTTGSLHDRLSAMGSDLLVHSLEEIDRLVPQPQPDHGVTYAAKIDKEEARIDWTRPAQAVDRQIRGLSPFPGAWIDLDRTRVKLLASRCTSGEGAPGTVLGAPLRVACGSGAVELTRLQRAGKGPQPVEEFLRGWPLPVGAQL